MHAKRKGDGVLGRERGRMLLEGVLTVTGGAIATALELPGLDTLCHRSRCAPCADVVRKLVCPGKPKIGVFWKQMCLYKLMFNWTLI